MVETAMTFLSTYTDDGKIFLGIMSVYMMLCYLVQNWQSQYCEHRSCYPTLRVWISNRNICLQRKQLGEFWLLWPAQAAAHEFFLVATPAIIDWKFAMTNFMVWIIYFYRIRLWQFRMIRGWT